jgi:uncharacterized protein YjiS (DUF1127 family)
MASTSERMFGNQTLHISVRAIVAGVLRDRGEERGPGHPGGVSAETLGTKENSQTPEARSFASMRDTIGGLATAIRRKRETRRAMAALAGADASTLRDLGISPGGIESAVRHGRN